MRYKKLLKSQISNHNNSMIEIKNITKSFGERQVLKGVSGTFKDAETSLIIGSSGTGKSVLLKCMLGLVPIDSGSVLL